MKKLFLAICFNVIFSIIFSAQARIIEVNDVGKEPPAPQPIVLPTPEGLPNPQNVDEVVEFFRERFKSVSVSKIDDLGDINKPNSMDVQHSAEYIAQMQEQKKSTFEKIYDQAMGRISGMPQEDVIEADTTFYEQYRDEVQSSTSNTSAPNIPVINVMLPTGKKIIAPAREHIPYLLSSFNILPTGLIQIEENMTVVANGQKAKYGITKIIPKYSTSRSNVRKKLDIQLLSVSINGKEVPHVLEEIGDNIHVKPVQKYTLIPGIYNYTFKYLVDRKLWYYEDFNEFYWDVTGSYWNLVVTSANAIVSIPDGKDFLTQNVIVGHPKQLTHNRATVVSLDKNALGFASTTPLLPGEGMHILVSLDKNTFIEPGIGRSFTWFITDYGDVLFALAGLAAILISYMLSWSYIKKNKTQLRVSFKRTAPALRYMLKGLFDKTTFVSALLELYRKNIIDIQKQDNTILLIKKTDNLSTLNRGEKKAINNLFPAKESVISATAPNALKFNRASVALEKSTKLLLKFLSLQLNLGYLLFSIGMVILVEIAIAKLGVNPLQTGLVLFSSTATIAFYTWILKRKFQSKALHYIIKTSALILILFSVLLISIYIKLISAILLAAMVYAIFEYSELFSKRNGLMKTKIKEAEELKKYLETNAEMINKSYEFSVQQANIFALNLENAYPENDINKRGYKLNIAQELVEKL